MRRAIAAAVVSGLVLGAATATPSLAATRAAGTAPRAARPRGAAPPAAGRAADSRKTVIYGGYEFQVPASWPVYRLDEHPRTCVRYDVHAVYLGRPGPDMRCPAAAVGRTQTVSLIPGAAAAPGTGPARGGRPLPAANGDVRPGSAVDGAVTQDAAAHQVSAALGATASGATLVGTYGTDPGTVERVLGTVRLAPAGAVPTGQAGPGPARSGGPAPGPASASWQGVPARWPVQIVQHPTPAPTPAPTPRPFRPVGGFDTCTAPSLAAMRAWRGDYAAVGVYIGGVNTGCAYGNLSPGWVRTVAGWGWGLLPTYVGPQAPCWGGSGVSIDPGRAVAEGAAAAADAVNRARSFGIGAGAPIYYDMEGYAGDASCTAAVLAFLGAWDRQVAAAGYLTGVYSSRDSGIADMQAAVAARTPGFTPPDAIWIALWDNDPSLSDGTLSWPLPMRAKQYAGNVSETVGGITLNIDKDVVAAPLATLPAVRSRGVRGAQPGSESGSREPP
jgi:hypothetical protein